MTTVMKPVWEQSTETVAGCRIVVRRCGAGPALLYLHGGGGSRGWPPFLDALARDFTVICPDHPGYGGSETPEWLDNIHDLAFFYLDVLAALGLSSVHLVGHSLGGWIAAELAVRNTSGLASLTLACPAGLHVRGIAPADIFLMPTEELIRTLYSDPRLAEADLAQPFEEAAQDQWLRNAHTTARLAWQPRLHDPHLPKWLHRIDVPTQIVWGSEDRILPSALAEHWRRHVPGSRIVWIERCGHLPQIEQPEAFASAVAGFARQALATASRRGAGR